ncbi:single-stranded DNA-binding protein [Rhodocyclus tenuis]|uniref:uracil-DNA glycosylase family protein n=1 Tax=Rhodocyclus gracilis TaxID=2929842 RepID=UPI001298CC3F|nr:uracil-DNA glycosylase family protein [Rhodocyclus gracilis]MRD73501.1 single-stranded DNA-binding protein [Rhodocyclus gracilis]
MTRHAAPDAAPTNATAAALIAAARELSVAVDALDFSPAASHVYNPLGYAWAAHEAYLRRYGAGRKRVVFLGMNPGPFGMAQCGVPFGEVAAVRDWLGIVTPIGKPAHENPKKPVEGFACTRSEVSGRRLWGLFRERFGTAEAFFAEHFVANWCPLAFFDDGRNLTPDKLPAALTAPLNATCDAHLRRVVAALRPEWVVGIGGFAEARAQEALAGMDVRIGRILHPSPASPAANRDWAGTATRQLAALGLWGESA